MNRAGLKSAGNRIRKALRSAWRAVRPVRLHSEKVNQYQRFLLGGELEGDEHGRRIGYTLPIFFGGPIGSKGSAEVQLVSDARHLSSMARQLEEWGVMDARLKAVTCMVWSNGIEIPRAHQRKGFFPELERATVRFARRNGAQAIIRQTANTRLKPLLVKAGYEARPYARNSVPPQFIYVKFLR